MRSEIKIPTLLGLGILLAGMIGGVFLISSPGLLNIRSKAASSVVISNVTMANISDTSASIYWQTNEDTPGFVEVSSALMPKTVFQDERDIQAPQNHKLHFVTIHQLTPDTTYNYSITSGAAKYPSTGFSTFKTASSPLSGTYAPIIGTILDSNRQPIDEAIITLQLEGSQKLAAISKLAGNFILPLAQLKKGTNQVNLDIFNTQLSSRISLNLPLDNQNLPPITLGQDMDLGVQEASPAAKLNPYDLNSDGVVNTLDRSIVLQNIKKFQDKRTDFNNDGKVDQKDLSLIDKFLAQQNQP